MIGICIALIIVTLTLGYFFFKKKYSYWSARGVPVPPYSPVLGHLSELFVTGHRWEYIDKIYKENEKGSYWGMYECVRPTLHIKDPELIRNVFVKDADHFVNRRSMKFPKKDVLFNEMLTVVEGEKWKALRSLMTPTFTSGKLKGMFPLISSVVDELLAKCDELMVKDSFVEMNSVLGKFTMEVVASCAFGIEANCLKEENSEFSTAVDEILSTNLSLKGSLKLAIMMLSSSLFEALGLRVTSPSLDFLTDVVKLTMKTREETGKKRGDFLDIMVEALEEHEKDPQKNQYPMSKDTIIAESVLFLFAGFDTTSSALSFTMYLLAKNPECQTKLRKELQKILEADEEFTYQNIMEAQYLEACISESLRLFSPAHFLERQCTHDYRIPGTELEVEKSMIVSVPIWSLHHDPKYWKEPTKFEPERFLPENKQNIVPYTYMPFGNGPRNCIAMRFALMEAKIALAKLCLEFEVSLKPGFDEVILHKSINILRPDKPGIPLIMKRL